MVTGTVLSVDGGTVYTRGWAGVNNKPGHERADIRPGLMLGTYLVQKLGRRLLIPARRAR